MPYTEPPIWTHGETDTNLIPRLNILVNNLPYFATEHAGAAGITCGCGFIYIDFPDVDRRPSFTHKRMHRWLTYQVYDDDDAVTLTLMREGVDGDRSEKLDAEKYVTKFFDLDTIGWLPMGAVYIIRNVRFAFELDLEVSDA